MSLKNTLVLLNLILSWLVLSKPPLALAEEAGVGFLLHGGETQFRGDLSSQQGHSTGVSLLVFNRGIARERVETSIGGLAGIVRVDIDFTRVRSGHNLRFPFQSERDLDLMSSAILFTPCIFANGPLQVCPGVGYSLITVSDNRNEQNYGSFRWEILLGHFVEAGLIGGIELRYAGVEQKVGGVSSDFHSTSVQASLGWAW